jgi:hypothetical protein
MNNKTPVEYKNYLKETAATMHIILEFNSIKHFSVMQTRIQEYMDIFMDKNAVKMRDA